MRDNQLGRSLLGANTLLIGGLVSTRHEPVLTSLTDVLETGPIPARYFLSAKACAGILRRATKRDKQLPAALEQALAAVAAG